MSLTRPTRALRARLPGLAGKAFGNSGTLFGTQLIQAALRFISFPIIAYYLDPADYGIFMVVGSLAITFTFLSETGVGPFTIRTEGGDDPRSLDTVWTISVLRGALIAGLMLISAPIAAEMMDDARVARALQIAAFGVFLFECRGLGHLLAQRQQDERRNALVRLGVATAALPVQVGLAVWLKDWRALVWGFVFMNVLGFAASFAFYPVRHRLLFDRAIALSLWRFSRMIAASTAVTLVVMQFDKYFILAVASLTLAGLFHNASNLIGIPEDLIRRHARGVFMPIAAARLRAGEYGPMVFYQPLRLVRPLLVLLCCGGITAGPAFIDVLLPDRYAGAGFFFSVLSLRATLIAIAQPQTSFLVADGGQRRVFFADTARLVWTVGAGLIGFAAFGIYGFVVAIALREIPPIIVQTHALMQRGVFAWRAEVRVVLAAGTGLALGALVAVCAQVLGLTGA